MTTAKPEERFVTVNGLRLRYVDWGTEGKPAMLCLHGHAGQLHIWDEFAQAMSPHYHVYALDQRGHGGSQWAADGYERDRFVADIDGFLDAFGISRVVLVGLSMGGWNSMIYASRHTDRVERVILVDIGPEISEVFRQQMPNRPPMPMQFATFEEAVAWGIDGDPCATEERVRRDIADRTRQRSDGRWIWKADTALFTTPLRDTADAESIARYYQSLGAITSPILLVRGSESLLISDEILDRMRKANPLLSAIDVERAGHVVPVDNPEGFIASTRSFLGVPS